MWKDIDITNSLLVYFLKFHVDDFIGFDMWGIGLGVGLVLHPWHADENRRSARLVVILPPIRHLLIYFAGMLNNIARYFSIDQVVYGQAGLVGLLLYSARVCVEDAFALLRVHRSCPCSCYSKHFEHPTLTDWFLRHFPHQQSQHQT